MESSPLFIPIFSPLPSRPHFTLYDQAKIKDSHADALLMLLLTLLPCLPLSPSDEAGYSGALPALKPSPSR